MKTVLIAFLALTLAACASTPDPSYTAYLDAQNAAEQARNIQLASIADVEACKGDSTCIVAAKGFAALAVAAGGNRSTVQQYRKQYHPAWGILGNAIPVLGQVWLGDRQARYSRDIAVSQHDFIGGMVDSIVGSPALEPRDPSITVGGDYVTGEQHIGDAIGRDAIGGDQHVGDWQNGNDIGGDDNSGNSGRINSPGPYDDNSGQCTGELCQGTGDTNPPPVDPGDGG